MKKKKTFKTGPQKINYSLYQKYQQQRLPIDQQPRSFKERFRQILEDVFFPKPKLLTEKRMKEIQEDLERTVDGSSRGKKTRKTPKTPDVPSPGNPEKFKMISDGKDEEIYNKNYTQHNNTIPLNGSSTDNETENITFNNFTDSLPELHSSFSTIDDIRLSRKINFLKTVKKPLKIWNKTQTTSYVVANLQYNSFDHSLLVTLKRGIHLPIVDIERQFAYCLSLTLLFGEENSHLNCTLNSKIKYTDRNPLWNDKFLFSLVPDSLIEVTYLHFQLYQCMLLERHELLSEHKTKLINCDFDKPRNNIVFRLMRCERNSRGKNGQILLGLNINTNEKFVEICIYKFEKEVKEEIKIKSKLYLDHNLIEEKVVQLQIYGNRFIGSIKNHPSLLFEKDIWVNHKPIIYRNISKEFLESGTIHISVDFYEELRVIARLDISPLSFPDIHRHFFDSLRYSGEIVRWQLLQSSIY
ncbi:hypothetical protein SNEBB_004681 [Seison nebaliae]|nr:hypothetical protein SNEBB_004681 [Seison nebaliae]